MVKISTVHEEKNLSKIDRRTLLKLPDMCWCSSAFGRALQNAAKRSASNTSAIGPPSAIFQFYYFGLDLLRFLSPLDWTQYLKRPCSQPANHHTAVHTRKSSRHCPDLRTTTMARARLLVRALLFVAAPFAVVETEAALLW